MEKKVSGLCLALPLSSLATAPSAHAWCWHRHRKDSANNSASSQPPKAKKERHHHEKASHAGDTASAMTNGPRSIGHWHPQPGPVGAGAK